MCNRSFCRPLQKSERAITLCVALLKRAIVLTISLFWKERQKERSLLRSFKKYEKVKMCEKLAIFQIPHFSSKKRAIAHCQTRSMRKWLKWAIGQLLICSFVHLFICSIAHCSFSLFSKERLCDRSLNCSLKKSECAIALWAALLKRAIVRLSTQSLFSKRATKRGWLKSGTMGCRTFLLSFTTRSTFFYKKKRLVEFNPEGSNFDKPPLWST